MTPEQLLQPRYKVIANYPHCPYRVGDLVSLNLNVPYPSFLCTITKDHDDVTGKDITSNNWQQLKEIEIYPHLFRPLEWWEERKAEDMPDFVKQKVGGRVFQVLSDEECNKPFVDDKIPLRFIYPKNYHYIPATESEYNAYINSK